MHFVGVITGRRGAARSRLLMTFSNDGTYRASRFNIVMPGQGSIVQDTGYIKFLPDGTVEIHGPHEAFGAWAPTAGLRAVRVAGAEEPGRGVRRQGCHRHRPRGCPPRADGEAAT